MFGTYGFLHLQLELNCVIQVITLAMMMVVTSQAPVIMEPMLPAPLQLVRIMLLALLASLEAETLGVARR